jgi:hypothetical protein
MKKFGFATRLRVIDADSIFFPFAASVVETSRRPAFGLRATVTLAVGKEGDKEGDKVTVGTEGLL